MSKRKRTKWQTMSYKTPHWKLKTEQHELHWKLGVNSGRVSSSCSTGGTVVLLQLQTRIPLKTKDREARIPLKTKDRATRTPLKTKDRATRTPLKTKDQATRTSLKIKDRATQTPLKTKDRATRTPLKTKDRAARTPLKTKDQATRTPLKTKDRATRTPLKTGGEFRKGKQFLVHWCHPSCCSSYKPGDKSWMRKNREVLTTSRTYP